MRLKGFVLLGGLEGQQLDGQLRRLEVARDAGGDERAGPNSMEKIKLPAQSYRQGRGSGLAIAVQPQVAENGIELPKVPRMEVDGECRGAGDRISAQMSVRLQLAGVRMQLQFA